MSDLSGCAPQQTGGCDFADGVVLGKQIESGPLAEKILIGPKRTHDAKSPECKDHFSEAAAVLDKYLDQ